MPKNKPKDKAAANAGVESSDLRGALTHRTTTDAYRKPKAKLGGQKSKHGLTFTTAQKELEAADPVSQRILAGGRKETASLKGGLTHGMTAHPYDGNESPAAATGTSIFDPVLCELAYRWFCPPGGQVLDPFAGGSVRGIVAARLGRQYLGIDLRAEQIKANEEQAKAICKKGVKPQWKCGDSLELAKLAKGVKADFVFSCPPYGDLERYSDDPQDLSTMDYPAFLDAYRKIIVASAALLKPDRFACFVVGDFRDPDGMYRGFDTDTALAFKAAGLELYNKAILVTAAGSLPVRVGRGFATARKLGCTHQYVLVFIKGDPRKATAAIGDVEFGEPEEFTAESTAYGERVTAKDIGGEI